MKALLFTLLLICFNLFSYEEVLSQQTQIVGSISDAKTGEPLPYVSLFIEKISEGTLSDFDGKFSIAFDTDIDSLTLKISYVGYTTQIIPIKTHINQIIDVKLVPESVQLKEVKVKADNSKYRNKDNPAVELIRKVIDNKSKNRKDAFDFYEFEKYEKIQFAINNITEEFKNKRAFNNFQFVFENIDTSTLGGKPILPLFLKETLSDVYYRQSPKANKEIIKGEKTIAFEGYVNNDGLGLYLEHMYQDVNIYENNITVLTNQFISPISSVAPTFYKFFIIDTITDNSTQVVKLGFVPRNHSDLLFQGYLFITLDGNYAITKIDLSVNNDINLNWVQKLKIVQRFEKQEEFGYVLVYDEFSADFGLAEGKTGVYGQRIVSYKNIKINSPTPAETFYGDPLVYKNITASDSFWTSNRHMELTKSEKGVYTTIDSIKNVPTFRRTMDIMVLIFGGFKRIGPNIDLGPFASFVSFNPIEGLRIKLGGRTTTDFSKKFIIEGYGAYGLTDEKWKYYLGTIVSLSKRNVNVFPSRNLYVNYNRDVKIPGQELQFVQEDNFFVSFRRGINDKWIYNNILKLEYLHEFRNHFSFAIGYKNWVQEAAGGIHFNLEDYNDPSKDINSLQTSELLLTLRWAPGEKFFQGKVYRNSIPTKNPIFTFRYVQGVKNLMGGDFAYKNLSLNIYKRFYLSQVGYTDVTLEGGKIFGEVPYPFLSIHQANQSYAYQKQSYNLMNFLEFVSDQYASVIIDHYFNGFFFNKVSLLKKLKWREAISFKVLYGSLNSNNNPENNPALLKFPVLPDGTPSTFSLNQKPYMEGSVGVGNIFKFLRIDLVKRFTYIDNPNISPLGIRARIKFDF